jgi:hypothetical protein
MRSAPLVLAAALACASAPQQLRPSDPAQTVAGEPLAGAASAAGVRVTVRPAAASGWIVDDRLTPVEVVIDNRSGRNLLLRPERFAVVMPDGARADALTREEIRRRYGPSVGDETDPIRVYQRSPTGVVYFPWANLPPGWVGIVPAATLAPSATLARKDLASGSAARVLLLFGLPAARLDRFELQAELVDPAGEPVATIRVPFERGPQRAEWESLPPIASPPPAG